MRQLSVLLIKFITCLIAFGIGLDLFFEASLADIVSFSVFVTISSYLIGEQIILPHLGKRAAAITDFMLTYLSVWIFGSILLHSYLQIAWGSLISATIVTVAEVFVHLFLQDRLPTRSPVGSKGFTPSLSYATEFAEDEDMRALSKNNSPEKK